MNYLEKIGFTSEEIAMVKDSTTKVIFNLLTEQKKVVNANILYLKNIGIKNYKEIFIKYSDLFLMDNSNFIEIFDKYDQDDLVEKLNNNIDIFAYL
ncbi:MAG: hypothetical protein IKX00_01320 [Bacilli bacterium]|nr:hypothetical protein [Bacilli bacterium]